MNVSKMIVTAVAGLAAGLFFGLSTPTLSQVTEPLRDSGESTADNSAELQAQIAALVSRVEDLEEAEREPKTAPFKIVNKQGQVIFVVDEAGSGANVRVYGGQGEIVLKTDSGPKINLSNGGTTTSMAAVAGESAFLFKSGAQAFNVSQASGGMLLSLEEGQTSVALLARAAGPLISADMGNKSVQLGATGKAFGFGLFEGEQPTIAMGNVGSGQPSLRVYGKGSDGPILQAGYHTNGINAISLWEGNNQLVNLSKATGGASGLLKIFDDGKEAVAIGKINDTIGLQVKSDDNVIFAGNRREGPEFSLEKGADKLFSVTSTGSNSTLRLGKKSSDNVELYIEPGKTIISALAKNKLVQMRVSQSNNGLLVESDDKPVAAIGEFDRKPLMNLYSPGNDYPMVSTGFMANGQPGIRVRESKSGKDLVVLTAKDGQQGEVRLYDSAGEIANMGSLKGMGTLVLSEAGTPAVSLGPTKISAIPGFRAYNKGQLMVAAGATPIGTGVIVTYGGSTIGAGMEGTAGGGGNVWVTNKGQTVASINSVDKPGQGLVVVRSPTGVSVATLGYGSSGGGNVTASDPSGSGVFSAGYVGGDGPGAACVSHKGTKCLGIGLTGMEGFH